MSRSGAVPYLPSYSHSGLGRRRPSLIVVNRPSSGCAHRSRRSQRIYGPFPRHRMTARCGEACLWYRGSSLVGGFWFRIARIGVGEVRIGGFWGQVKAVKFRSWIGSSRSAFLGPKSQPTPLLTFPSISKVHTTHEKEQQQQKTRILSSTVMRHHHEC